MHRPLPTAAEMAALIDHAVLKPEATADDVRAACDMAARLKLGCLCVRPRDVPLAARRLDGTGVVVGSVAGFPHGSCAPAAKAADAAFAIEHGALEIDMVAAVGALRDGDVAAVRDDIAAVVRASQGRLVKVILECCYLTRPQMAAGCQATVAAGAAFVKTSTGFGPYGARAEDVEFLRRQVGPGFGVKAAGGIRSLADALAMLHAGADRLGTSAGEAILAEMGA